jgi:hypothetical protein
MSAASARLELWLESVLVRPVRGSRAGAESGGVAGGGRCPFFGVQGLTGLLGRARGISRGTHSAFDRAVDEPQRVLHADEGAEK